MKKLIVFTGFLAGLILFLSANAIAEDDLTLNDRELENLAKDMKALFDAKTLDDRSAEMEATLALTSSLDEVAAKKGIKNVLKYPDAIFRIKELTINTKHKSARVFKSKAGKGFQENYFEDPTDNDRNYKYFVSLPKGYKTGGGDRFPVLIYLHSETGGGSRVLKDVREELKLVFNDKELLEKTIILAPVGPVKGKRKVIDAAEDWELLDPGRKTAFIGLRVLLEMMVFDRSRVFIMGMGPSGAVAYKFSTWYPSLFSGAVAVDAPVTSLFYENARDLHLVYISTPQNRKNHAEQAAAMAAKYPGDNGGTKAIFIDDAEDPGKRSRLATKSIAALNKLMDRAPKKTIPTSIMLRSIDLEFSANAWLKIDVMNNTASMKIGDEDLPYVDAKVDRESNSFNITSNRVGRFRLFLNDKLVDMDKKITVNLNGKKRWEGTKERNMLLMLNMLYENWAGDYEVYTNYIDIEEEDA